MSGVLGYMSIPGVYIRNGSSQINGETFDDITDWGGSFIEGVRAALLKLSTGTVGNGKALLDTITMLLANGSRKITIEPAAGFDGQGGSGWDRASSLVRWFQGEQPNSSDDLDQLNGIPSFIILGHELIHAMHTLQGRDTYGHGRLTDIAIEEAATIGLGLWKDNGLTENGLRAEWGLRPRTSFRGAEASRLLKNTQFLG